MSRLSKIRPNFFLIGAPKCGTTALCEYLGEHPEIRLSNPKEAKFFHTDFSREHRLADSLEGYLGFFGDDLDQFPAVGEGTVWYLFSEEAVPNILEFNPEARFLVMLRNPVDLVHSLHSQLLFGGDEDVEDFGEAWRLQEERRAGRSLPRFCRDPKSLQYGEIGRLGAQIERLYRVVPRDRVHAILYDDFRRSPADVYGETLGFLGVKADSRSQFPVVNANKQIAWRGAANFLHWAAAAKRRLGLRRSLGVWRLLAPLFARRATRSEFSPELRRQLVSWFRDDIELLESLLGRDLSRWE